MSERDPFPDLVSGRGASRPTEVLLFMTTQAALRGEDGLLEAGLDVDVVPTPEGLRRLCGIALEIPAAQLGRAVEVLEEAGVPFFVYEPARGDAVT